MTKNNTKVLIITSSSFTIGDVAIAESMIQQIRTILPNSAITIESANPQQHVKYIKDKNITLVRRLFDAEGIKPGRSYLSLAFLINNGSFIFRYTWDLFELMFFALFKISLSKRPVFSAFKQADIIISAGGDALTQHYGYFLRLITFAALKRLRKPIVIYASTIGPFPDNLKNIVRWGLDKTNLIMARDAKSYDFVRALRLTNAEVVSTADVVISLKPTSTGRVTKLVKALSIDRNTVCIFLKANAFSGVGDAAYVNYLDEIASLIPKLQAKNLKVVIGAANKTDYTKSTEFIKKHRFNIKVFDTLALSPGEAMSVLSKSKIVISSRMHPIIISSIAKVPIIGVSDESKMLEYLKIIGMEKNYITQTDFSAEVAFDLIMQISSARKEEVLKLEKGIIQAKQKSAMNQTYLKDFLLRHKLLV